MLKTLEKQTKPLNKYEREILLPVLIAGLRTKRGIENAISNKKICDTLTKKEYKLSPERVRKIIHIIRAEHYISRLIATSKGYYIATTVKELRTYKQTLIGRKTALEILINVVDKDLNEINC